MQITRATALVIAAAGVLVVVLATGLPPETFFNGDPGVKFVAARAAWSHPARPLEIDLPVIGGQRLPFLEPFYPVHGDHAHAVTSEFFALISSPFVGVWGFGGAYVLPAVGFLTAVAGCAWLAHALDHRRHPAVIAAMAAIATPWLFYGLEFWEHAPAVGAASVGAAAFVSDRRLSRSAMAGLLLGASALLRPEALCFAAALVVASWRLPRQPGVRALAAFGVACAAALIPLMVYSVVHFGTILTPHISDNNVLLSRDWLASRLAFAGRWLIPSFINGAPRPTDVWVVAPAIVLALMPLPARASRGGRAFLAILTVVYVALALVAAPNDGGAQWGPRYLLFAYVPAVILAGDAVVWFAADRRLVIIAVGLLAASVWMDRRGYKDLRSSKFMYGRLVTFVEQHSASNEPIVSDLIWLDQVAVDLSNKRTFLYAAQPQTRQQLVAALDRARVPGIVLVNTDKPSADADAWFTGTCYEVDNQSSNVEHHLVAVHARRRCGPA